MLAGKKRNTQKYSANNTGIAYGLLNVSTGIFNLRHLINHPPAITMGTKNSAGVYNHPIPSVERKNNLDKMILVISKDGERKKVQVTLTSKKMKRAFNHVKGFCQVVGGRLPRINRSIPRYAP